MKRNLVALFLAFPLWIQAQQHFLDSIKQEINQCRIDSVKYQLHIQLFGYYGESNRSMALHHLEAPLSLLRKNRKKLSEAQIMGMMAYQLFGMGRYDEAFQRLTEALVLAENPANKDAYWLQKNTNDRSTIRVNILSQLNHFMGLLMNRTQNTDQAIYYLKKGVQIAHENSLEIRESVGNMNLGLTYYERNDFDSAMHYLKLAEALIFKTGYKNYLGNVYSTMGDIHLKKGQTSVALNYYYSGIHSSLEQKVVIPLARNYLRLANYYLSIGHKDSSVFYALKNGEILKSSNAVFGHENDLGIAYEKIYQAYALQNNRDSAYKYQGLTLKVKDSIYGQQIASLAAFQRLTYDEKLRLKNLENEKQAYQNRVRSYVLLSGLIMFSVLALILYRNSRQKQKANKILEATLENLKATQSQLIQSEKMASLGELTAGIAHEIQNPLNFVNNFSEVNAELLVELEQEAQKGNLDEVKSIAKDLKENEQKIVHHGKRADAIVKGMLQHSRSSSGKKEPTDINALADEYLRLAYHGLRAKDKTFNAGMKTELDASIGKVHVVPQDMGRVILNLISNAFYAVNEKKQLNLNGYEPMVSVSTKRVNGGIELKVQDNGNGIPQHVMDKIFQPFFTTKPTGQGTGLGLSLAYDIVKAHGGELKVETMEGAGSEFIILLPI